MAVSTLTKDRAIVLGAGMSGLLAACALSRHFARVTLIDRDQFPEQPVPRPGVPQAQHLHVFLKRGQLIAEEFLPGLRQQALEAGAVSLNWGQDTAWMNPKGWAPRFAATVNAYSCSRWLLEYLIHQQVRKIPQVEILNPYEVEDFLIHNNQVQAVKIRNKTNNAQEEIAGDLVVDATGRHSKMPQILHEQHGYTWPQETKVNSFLGYASQQYTFPNSLGQDWQQLYIQMSPPEHCRGGVLYPIEGNQWIVTLIGACKDYPPATEKGFLEFAKSLRSPLFHETLSRGQSQGKIYCYRRTENRRRRYQVGKSLPAGYLVVGDNACALNPVYGQGMTVAALAAELLDQLLYQPPQHKQCFSQVFQDRLYKLQNTPWFVATSEDYRLTEHTPLSQKFLHWGFDRILINATRDQEVYQTFLEVLHMIRPLSALARPKYFLLKS